MNEQKQQKKVSVYTVGWRAMKKECMMCEDDQKNETTYFVSEYAYCSDSLLMLLMLLLCLIVVSNLLLLLPLFLWKQLVFQLVGDQHDCCCCRSET